MANRKLRYQAICLNENNRECLTAADTKKELRQRLKNENLKLISINGNKISQN